MFKHRINTLSHSGPKQRHFNVQLSANIQQQCKYVDKLHREHIFTVHIYTAVKMLNMF